MIEEVNKIIYNMLISGRGVFLPEVGSLYIERQGARRLSDGRLLSPRNVVVFKEGVQAPSLVEEIVLIASCGKEQAQDIYDRWKAKTIQEGVLTISGVGVLKGKSFTSDKAFHSAINPQGVKTLVVRKKSSNKWLYAIVGVAVVVALGFFAFVMWGDKIMGDVKVVKSTDTEQVAVAPAETDVVAEAEQQPATTEQTPVEETPVAQPVAQPSSYEYYVVMGIFSTPENAERAVKQVQSKIKDVECVVLPFKGGKHMVAIFGSNSVAECNTFARSYRDVYPDLWVYNNK